MARKNDDDSDKTLKPSKGILKRSSTHCNESSGQRTLSKEINKKLSIKWDEKNIIATLHPAGKDYGTVKINEVPTPFERPTDEDGKGVDAQTLAKRLKEANASWSTDNSEGEENEKEVKRRRELFLKKRKQHYKVFIDAKKKKIDLEDADDEDSDNDPHTIHK